MLSGGTWTSEKTNSSIHWAQPNVISLASKDGDSSDGTKVIEDIDGMVNKLNVWISKATLLALVDKQKKNTRIEKQTIGAEIVLIVFVIKA